MLGVLAMGIGGDISFVLAGIGTNERNWSWYAGAIASSFDARK